jgi:hypothetical protein
MSAVKYVFRKNTLGPQVDEPGGLSVEDAVRAAEQNVAAIQDESVAEVDRNIDLLARSAAAVAADSANLSAREEVYAHANVIAGLAGCCGLGEVGQAAFCLCDLTDLYIVSGSWNADAVAVHLSAIAVLRSPDIAGAPEMRRSVLAGLHEIVLQARRLLAEGAASLQTAHA